MEDDFTIWGPYAWCKFHKKAIEYPENPCSCDIKEIRQYYYKIFLKYIDCKSCVKDYKKIIWMKPIKVKSRTELFNWTVDIHNTINMKLCKLQIGYKEAYIYWCDKISKRKSKKREQNKNLNNKFYVGYNKPQQFLPQQFLPMYHFTNNNPYYY